MLTDLQRQKLPNLFRLHDTDRDGYIEPEDFDLFAGKLAQSRGLSVDSDEAAELRARFANLWEMLSRRPDGSQAERLDLDGRFAFWDHVFSTDGMYDRVAQPIGGFVFHLLDTNGSGHVAAEEYMQFYKAMTLDEASAREAFDRLDQNGSGTLSIDEIMTMLDQYFRSDDPDAPGNWFFGPYAEA